MNNKIQIKNIRELPPVYNEQGQMRGLINCITLDDKMVEEQFSSPLSLNALMVILVLSGTATIQINYKSYIIESNKLVLLSVSHLFNFKKCSSDFKSLNLLVSKEFMEEMDATDMIYRRIKYGSRVYNRPVIEIGEAFVPKLKKRMLAIDETIDSIDHLYYKEMILNSLFAFYLELSNAMERDESSYNDGNFTRHEDLIKSFIELLIKNYRTEHRVEFYSSQLNITSHYLTLIVKRITGQTVSDFIYEMLYSEARNLLIHSQLSIQEITVFLNFSDQSSFGKFFKRISGVSPKDYRRKGSGKTYSSTRPDTAYYPPQQSIRKYCRKTGKSPRRPG